MKKITQIMTLFLAFLLLFSLFACARPGSTDTDEPEQTPTQNPDINNTTEPEETYSAVVLDNGFYTDRVVLEAPLTAEEIAVQYPGDQNPGENGTMNVAISVDEETRKFTEAYLEEREHVRYITQRPDAYEAEGFQAYSEIADMLYVLHQWGNVMPKSLFTAEDAFFIDMLKTNRENLVQTQDPETDIWYIWGDDMPCADDASDYDWRYAFDAPDFKPFLIPYLVEDQSQVVGNIVMVSGGADAWRSNTWEGYPAAERFRDMGYNCFVLQRRVAPYERIDGALDLQRSIRYIRSHAEELNISNTDRMAVCGFSGGGGTIINMLSYCYDTASPETIRPSYTPDAIDTVNSAVDVAILMYGVSESYLDGCVEGLQNNPTLPAIFMVAGQDDFASMDLGSIKLYNLLNEQVPIELHILAETVHGFGVGACNISDGNENFNARVVNTESWPELADMFIKLRYGLVEKYDRL